MSGKPAARLGDPTACPLPGHGSNPIVGGSPDVFFDHLSAARQGDATACGATLSANVIANVLINGKPATVVGSVGTHGNLVVGGAGTVLIGNSGGGAPALALAPPKLCLQCLLLAARRNQALVPWKASAAHREPAPAGARGAYAGQPPVRPGGRRPLPDPGHPPGKGRGEIRSRWLLAGSELDEIAHAGPVLIEFMDSAPLSSSGEFLGWLRDWDRRSPMASWLWSRASFENLAKHFAGLLFTRMPDGRRALLRYYSPEVRRALEQVMTARQWTQVMAPLERWQVWQPLQGGYLVYDRETERTADA